MSTKRIYLVKSLNSRCELALGKNEGDPDYPPELTQAIIDATEQLFNSSFQMLGNRFWPLLRLVVTADYEIQHLTEQQVREGCERQGMDADNVLASLIAHLQYMEVEEEQAPSVATELPPPGTLLN